MIKQNILPIMLVSFLALSACSQQSQNGKGSAAGNGGSSMSNRGGANGGGNGANGSGATSGGLGRGGASGVNSSETRGGGYLPGGANGGGKGGAGSGGNGSGGANSNSGDGDINIAGLKDPNNLLSSRIIYFDYDRASIRPEYKVIIETHAELLSKYPNLKMRLEGHADERGSREYNVALSEARAQSVKSLMGIYGALGAQIKTIGYGEEEPVVRGHNEKSWQKNRRVEIKYSNED